MQLLGEDNWGNPSVNGHFSLELGYMVGHRNPLGQNTVRGLDALGSMDLGQEGQNLETLLYFP
jgi:hypothetical protein